MGNIRLAKGSNISRGHPGQQRQEIGLAGLSAVWVIFPAEVTLVDGANHRAVLLVTSLETIAGLCPLETQAVGQVVEGLAICRESVSLAVVHQLEVMLHRSQEDVAIDQDPVFIWG